MLILSDYDTPYSSDSKSTRSSSTDELHAYEKFSEHMLPILVEPRLRALIEEGPIADVLLDMVRLCHSQMPVLYAQQKANGSSSSDAQIESLGSAVGAPSDFVTGGTSDAQDTVVPLPPGATFIDAADTVRMDSPGTVREDALAQVHPESDHVNLIAGLLDSNTTSNDNEHATGSPPDNALQTCLCLCHLDNEAGMYTNRVVNSKRPTNERKAIESVTTVFGRPLTALLDVIHS